MYASSSQADWKDAYRDWLEASIIQVQVPEDLTQPSWLTQLPCKGWSYVNNFPSSRGRLISLSAVIENKLRRRHQDTQFHFTAHLCFIQVVAATKNTCIKRFVLLNMLLKDRVHYWTDQSTRKLVLLPSRADSVVLQCRWNIDKVR